MGLSISHSIISNHGGDITVCSRVGAGTTFHVLLPASKVASKVVHTVGDNTPSGETDKPISGMGRVLVMDDEAMIREIAHGIGNEIRML